MAVIENGKITYTDEKKTIKIVADAGGKISTAYTPEASGYKFLRWEDSEGNTLSEVQDFYYVMPHGNEVIYGVFDFDPATPSNPAKNYWNNRCERTSPFSMGNC